MAETIAVIFGMVFVGTILICLVWTILSYIFEATSRDNKLEENIKRWDKVNGKIK